MQNYKRKITYFYEYHNGKVGSTAGFLKLEIRGDKVKIIVNIQEQPGLPYRGAALYFYHEAGDHLAAIKVDQVESMSGVLTYQTRTDWQQLFQTGRDLYTFDGVAVVYNDSHYYIGDFQDRNRKDYALVLKEAKPQKPEPEKSRMYSGKPHREKEVADSEEKADNPLREQSVLRGENKQDSPNDSKALDGENHEGSPILEHSETVSGLEQGVSDLLTYEEEAGNPESEAWYVHQNPEQRTGTGTRRTQRRVVSRRNVQMQGTQQNMRSRGTWKEQKTRQASNETREEKLSEAQKHISAENETETIKNTAEMAKDTGNYLYAGLDTDSGEADRIHEKCATCPYYKKESDQKEYSNAFEKMLGEYPKLPMYGATELFDCVRIHPRDIGRLDMRNWKLGVNSFLTHGFYTYQYLLLGKMRFDDGSQHGIIGVPGVFSNREKYLAGMFGFDQFIPVKKTGVKTGEFGYWIVEISPYL